MRLLLDTHTLLWWLTDDPALSATARKSVARSGNTILVSAASAWEIAMKFRLGKLPDTAEVVSDFTAHLQRERFENLLISAECHPRRVAAGTAQRSIRPDAHRSGTGRRCAHHQQ